jgi:hypothetical protein
LHFYTLAIAAQSFVISTRAPTFRYVLAVAGKQFHIIRKLYSSAGAVQEIIQSILRHHLLLLHAPFENVLV